MNNKYNQKHFKLFYLFRCFFQPNETAISVNMSFMKSFNTKHVKPFTVYFLKYRKTYSNENTKF